MEPRRTGPGAEDLAQIGGTCECRTAMLASALNDRGSVSAIAHLLPLRRPAAILRAIGALIVDSVQGMLRRRTLAHVSKKPLEGLPGFANIDTACAIDSVVGMSRIFASLPHLKPGRMLRSSISAMGSPCIRLPKAAAASRMSRGDMRPVRGEFPTAGAAADPDSETGPL